MILITGATGFIGRYLTKALLQKEEMVIPVSKNGGNIDGTEVLAIDLTNRDQVTRLFDVNFDTIFHLAAEIPLTLEESNNPELASSNKKMTQNIVDLCNNNSCLIFSSSTSIYHSIQTEYSKGQFIEERICLNSCDINKSVVCFRISSPYGKGMHQTVLKTFIDKALSGEPLVIYGNSTRCQDFIYVDDIISGLLLSSKNKASGVYNLCSGVETSMLELAQKVIKVLGSNSIIQKQPGNQDDDRTNYSIGSTRKVFGYKPKLTISQGIKKLC